MSTNRPAVFLDRDGTINEEVNYLSRVEDFRMLPGVASAIRLLNDEGWAIVVVTNQSGIARGYYSVEDVTTIHTRMRSELAQAGAWIDGIYYCPHLPSDGCACRKPGTLLFRQAAEELHLDLARSVLVGDKLTDLQPARELGSRTVLVLTGYGMEHLQMMRQQQWEPDWVAQDLQGAAQWIKQHNESSPRL